MNGKELPINVPKNNRITMTINGKPTKYEGNYSININIDELFNINKFNKNTIIDDIKRSYLLKNYFYYKFSTLNQLFVRSNSRDKLKNTFENLYFYAFSENANGILTFIKKGIFYLDKYNRLIFKADNKDYYPEDHRDYIYFCTNTI